MAELSARPFPPGDYPVVVVGSGPGALQVVVLAAAGSGSITRSSRPTRRPAGCSGAGRSSSASCRGPSRTPRPRAARRAVRALRLEQPARRRARARAPSSRRSWTASRTSRRGRRWRRTSRPFAERAGIDVRYGCRWTGTRARSDRAGRRPVRRRDDRRRRTAAEVLVVAVGVAEPYTPPGPGMEHTHHYADVRPAETYAERGCSSSASRTPGFELATGPAAVGAPARPRRRRRTARLSVETRVAGRRPRALRPAVRGPRPGRRRQRPRRRDRPDRAGRRRRR